MSLSLNIVVPKFESIPDHLCEGCNQNSFPHESRLLPQRRLSSASIGTLGIGRSDKSHWYLICPRGNTSRFCSAGGRTPSQTKPTRAWFARRAEACCVTITPKSCSNCLSHYPHKLSVISTSEAADLLKTHVPLQKLPSLQTTIFRATFVQYSIFVKIS